MNNDLPDPENWVIVDANRHLPVKWKPDNRAAHERLFGTPHYMRWEVAYPACRTENMGIETKFNQSGTLRYGDDPATEVIDPCCRSFYMKNLSVVDLANCRCSSAINPATAIAAQALGVTCNLI